LMKDDERRGPESYGDPSFASFITSQLDRRHGNGTKTSPAMKEGAWIVLAPFFHHLSSLRTPPLLIAGHVRLLGRSRPADYHGFGRSAATLDPGRWRFEPCGKGPASRFVTRILGHRAAHAPTITPPLGSQEVLAVGQAEKLTLQVRQQSRPPGRECRS
jgi:hypothetical protein